MPFAGKEAPISVIHAHIKASPARSLAASDGFKWSTSQRLWRPAGEPWLRRELLVLWTFLLVLSVVTYFVVRLVSEMQTNSTLQTQSTMKLTDQVAALAATQDKQKNKIAQVQGSYQQVSGTVDSLGSTLSAVSRKDEQLAAELKSLNGRIRLLEHQQAMQRATVLLPPAAATVIPRPAASVPTPAPAARAANADAAPQLSNSAPWTQDPAAGHVHQFLTDITPPKAAEVKQVGGEESVWMIAKNGVTMLVRPFGISSLGTWVHCSTDGRDYILTPSGGWMSGSPRP